MAVVVLCLLSLSSLLLLLLLLLWVGLRRTALRRTAQNFALFLPFPATVSLFLCLSGCLLVEFWWCLKRRGLKCARFGLSGCRVKPRRPHQTGPPGLAHDSPRTPNVHISDPCASNTTKIQREDTQRDTERAKWWREREEKTRNFGPPTLRGPTLRGPTLRSPTLRSPTIRGRFGQSRPISVSPDSATFWIQHPWLFNPESDMNNTPHWCVPMSLLWTRSVNGSLPCDGGSPTRLPASYCRALCFQPEPCCSQHCRRACPGFLPV